ncbi:hypothetical protein NEOLEDRAFT_987106 [Neolentinus lepideus HHB14362 ss-1]|uniref:Uncharacterized protein n=1 Tax=Neolentinus lepideus HHB14362 ss-1 TaxID=1314782 RepID=A0A165N5K5_9AGAM|nr:hypothetical protein NEOLEDRAFT_987106 [Neolentinus lepideus HHB14362 ss-1]
MPAYSLMLKPAPFVSCHCSGCKYRRAGAKSRSSQRYSSWQQRGKQRQASTLMSFHPLPHLLLSQLILFCHLLKCIDRRLSHCSKAPEH